MSDQKQPDWDKITEGKIRHGVAVEAFSQGMELNKENAKKIEQWVQFIIHGYEGLNAILEHAKKDSKPLSDNDLKEEVVDKFDGKVVEETDEDYVKKEIENAIKTLGQKDKNKVLYQLKAGNITLDNLQACLDKIGTMKHF
jgi:hypothetical protein|tara:strand:+ start:576 stop:998 length:423 start_codon:yes stop_codon:yes gene_type:complete